MDKRLKEIKQIKGAMHSYIYLIYEFVLEARWNKVLEIGVYRGHSTRAILLAMSKNKKGTLVSIDILNRDKLLKKWRSYDDLQKHWKFICGDTGLEPTFIAAESELEAGEMYDMLFIDGDHRYERVKHDFNKYSELVKPGGVILIHDVTNRRFGVKEFWPEITWDKFIIDWGFFGNNVIPGLGLVKKP